MSDLNKLKEDPELLEKLREEVQDISGAVRRLLAGPVNRRAIIVLLHDLVPNKKRVSRDDIETVLDAIVSLDTQYLKQKIKS